MFVVDQIALSEFSKSLRVEIGKRADVVIQHTAALGAVSAGLGFRNRESATALVRRRPIMIGKLMCRDTPPTTPRQAVRQFSRLVAWETKSDRKPAVLASRGGTNELGYSRLAAVVVAAGKAARLTTYLEFRSPGNSDVRRLDVAPRFEVRNGMIVCSLRISDFDAYDCAPELEPMASRASHYIRSKTNVILTEAEFLGAWTSAFRRAVIWGSDGAGWEEKAAFSMLHPVWQRDEINYNATSDDALDELSGGSTLEQVGIAILNRAFDDRRAAFFPTPDNPMKFGSMTGFHRPTETQSVELTPVNVSSLR